MCNGHDKLLVKYFTLYHCKYLKSMNTLFLLLNILTEKKTNLSAQQSLVWQFLAYVEVLFLFFS